VGHIRSDEVGFLHPTQFVSLGRGQDGDSAPQAPEFQRRYFWCRDHKLAICSEVLPKLYRAARDAYSSARNDPSQAARLMSLTKALLILCPDMLTAWNSRFALSMLH
jgi:protein prenyltransferase alpha subunit repeat containing protein 1